MEMVKNIDEILMLRNENKKLKKDLKNANIKIEKFKQLINEIKSNCTDKVN